MSNGSDKNLTSLEHAGAGAFSGFVTRFICQPLDVIKILFQLQVDPKASSKYTSIMQAFSVIVKEEGASALWKGHVPAQFMSIAFGAIQFSIYEKIINVTSHNTANSTLFNDAAKHFYAGAASGLTATVVSFPLDTIRTRLVAQTIYKQYNGLLDAGKQILIEEGTKGFFRGLLPTCVAISVSSSLIFGFKNIYNQLWNICMFDTENCFEYSTRGHLVSGLLAGLTAKTVTYPLDVVKKRLQIQGMAKESLSLNTKSDCKGFVDCILKTLQNEGFFGLYKGASPALLKSGVANAINFTIYYEVCWFLKYLKR